jgi:hypothetical protein
MAQLPREMVQLYMKMAQLLEEMVQLSAEKVQLLRKLWNARNGATLSRKSEATRGNVAIYEEWSNYLRIWAPTRGIVQLTEEWCNPVNGATLRRKSATTWENVVTTVLVEIVQLYLRI